MAIIILIICHRLLQHLQSIYIATMLRLCLSEVLCTGCSAIANTVSPVCECPADYLSSLSMEMLCYMLSYLPLRDIMKLDVLSHWLRKAVTMYLRLTNKINLTEDKIYGWMPTAFCDKSFARFVSMKYINY